MKADRDKVVPLIKTARGQLDGILKMIDEDRYCIDISNQVLAVISILGKANKEIIPGPSGWMRQGFPHRRHSRGSGNQAG